MTKSRGINKPRSKFEPWQLAILINCYACSPNSAIMKATGLPLKAIYTKASKLGLKKSDWFYEQHPGSGSTKFHMARGQCGRFKKGHKSWNAGVKGLYFKNSEKGWFKKGQRGSNWLPIGAVRVTADGYYEVKMTATGYPPKDWVPIHRVVWERCTGKPVPPGHVVRYRDGNYQNYEISNLDCISKAEHCRLNSVHRYGPEFHKVSQLMGAINRQINKKQEYQHG